MIDVRSCRVHLLVFALVAGAGAAATAQQDGEVEFNAGLTHLREGRTEMAVESFKVVRTE